MDGETLFDEIFINTPDPTRELLYTLRVICDGEESNEHVYADSKVSLNRLIQLCNIAGHVVCVKDSNGNDVPF